MHSRFVTTIESTISLEAGEICCKAERARVFSNNRDVYGTKLTLITPKRPRNWKRRKRSSAGASSETRANCESPSGSRRRRRSKGEIGNDTQMENRAESCKGETRERVSITRPKGETEERGRKLINVEPNRPIPN